MELQKQTALGPKLATTLTKEPEYASVQSLGSTEYGMESLSVTSDYGREG